MPSVEPANTIWEILRIRKTTPLALSLVLLLAAFVNDAPASRIARKVVFMGDSISYLWQTTDSWPTESKWIDVGVPGMTTEWMQQNLQTLALSQHPGILHVLGGTNDVHLQLPLEQSIANISAMLSAARKLRVPVILGTIPPWGDGSAATECPVPNCYARIDALNAWIRAQSGHGVTVVDYHAALSVDGKHFAPGLACNRSNPCMFPNYQWVVADAVHPNAAGYRVMMKALAAAKAGSNRLLPTAAVSTPRR